MAAVVVDDRRAMATMVMDSMAEAQVGIRMEPALALTVEGNTDKAAVKAGMEASSAEVVAAVMVVARLGSQGGLWGVYYGDHAGFCGVPSALQIRNKNRIAHAQSPPWW
jgi:hypothetical protein